MWQRFTERARQAIWSADAIAKKHGSAYLSTEHILVGLVDDAECIASRILESLGVPLDEIRAKTLRSLQKAEPRDGEMTLTPRAKRSIDLAYYEAKELGDEHIGTEHLLLGLIREAEGLAGRVLTSFGVGLDTTRAVVQNMISDGQNADRAGWSRFEPDAKAILVAAGECAKAHRLSKIEPEHIVFALSESADAFGDAGTCLKDQSIREFIAQQMRIGEDELPEHLGWTTSAHDIVLESYKEAGYPRRKVGPRDLLVATARRLSGEPGWTELLSPILDSAATELSHAQSEPSV